MELARVSDEFESLAAQIEAWQPQREAMRQNAIQWLKSPAFRSSFYDGTHPPAGVKHVLEQTSSKAEAARGWRTLK